MELVHIQSSSHPSLAFVDVVSDTPECSLVALDVGGGGVGLPWAELMLTVLAGYGTVGGELGAGSGVGGYRKTGSDDAQKTWPSYVGTINVS